VSKRRLAVSVGALAALGEGQEPERAGGDGEAEEDWGKQL
jgi:hypothetical protein